MVNIKDVAKKAGVSVTTVSRTMNNRGYISKETRTKVEQAIKKLDYQPNQIARALFKKHSYVIGIIVPDLSHPFFAEIINWIEAYASDRNYKILVCNSLHDADKEKKYLDMLRQHRVDGIIMCSHTLDVDAYQKTKMPIVSFDRIISPSIPYVASNNYKGGVLATKHLIDRNCKKLLHISGPLTNDLLANRRADAFQATCTESGIDYKIIEGAYVKSTFEDNWNFIENKIAPPLSEFDGVFCSNDIIAYTLFVFASKAKIRIPEQLKIIGYDYHSFTRMLKHPILTTIKQPVDLIGKKLCSTLIDKIENASVGNCVFDVQLIKGETT